MQTTVEVAFATDAEENFFDRILIQTESGQTEAEPHAASLLQRNLRCSVPETTLKLSRLNTSRVLAEVQI
jgi:hypothetical protein